MDKTKLLNAIGMCYSARKLVSGEKLLDFIKTKKVKLVFIGYNMGPTSKKKVTDKCKFYEIEYFDQLLSVEEIAQACGKKTLVSFGINDLNMIKLLKSTI